MEGLGVGSELLRTTVSSRWTTRGPLPSLGPVIAVGIVGVAGVALAVFGIADAGPGFDLRLAASVAGLLSGLVTLGASAVAAGRRRRGLFDAERRIEDLQRLAARLRRGRPALTEDEDRVLRSHDFISARVSVVGDGVIV